jgi:flagellar basal-body rod modification protein FlgD
MSTTIGGVTGGSGMTPMASTAGSAATNATNATNAMAGSATPATAPFGSATGATGGAASPFGSAAGATGATSGTAAPTDASSIAGTDTFLKLLVAQMRNQDPTSPMDSQSFVTELAQFNTVEQMLGMKEAVTAQIAAQQNAEGVALLGKTITYATQGVGGNVTTSQGVVSAVGLQGGTVQLQVGTDSVPLSKVTAVSAQ